jgi:acyl-CoA synthetase (AMP-forming)/AMP-acid ligase II
MNNSKSSSVINPDAMVGQGGDDPRVEWKKREGGNDVMEGSGVIIPDAMLKKRKGDVVKIQETMSQGGGVPGMGGDIIKGSGQKCQAEENGDEEDKSGKMQKGVPTGSRRLLSIDVSGAVCCQEAEAHPRGTRAEDFATITTIEGTKPRSTSPEGSEVKFEVAGFNPDLVESPSFLHILCETVSGKFETTFAIWYDDSGKAVNQYTFGELWTEAGVIAYSLRYEWGVLKGDRVVLCYNFGLHFFAAFLGCLRAGVTAVLVYPPSMPLVKSLPKMLNVLDDCHAKLILTDSDVNLLRRADMLNPLSKSRHLWPSGIEYKNTSKLGEKTTIGLFSLRSVRKDVHFDEETISPTDLAFLQYTSGSTGDPKGVMVTFGALTANLKLIHDSCYQSYRKSGGIPEEIIGFSWLPQYHDMGLIYALIAPFATGWRVHMMSPLSFIKNPLLWLELMSRNKVTWSVAPDFAFRLVTRKFYEARKLSNQPIPGLDLSSIRYLQTAAEPIRLDTREYFDSTFKDFNLRDNWFCAGYGLAENVVGCTYLDEYVTTQDPGRGNDISLFVAVGHTRTFPSAQVLKVVDPQTLVEVADGAKGELWVAGPSVALGYYKKPELTKETFEAKIEGVDLTFLRTGDLAFFQEGYLYICGRIKDLIIINGVNYYPQDIEAVVQDASKAIRPGCVAAFASNDTGNDGSLEIVFEIRRSATVSANEILALVLSGVVQNIGVSPSRVVAIKENTIPKTTSGKIRRGATRSALHTEKLAILLDWNGNSQDDKIQPSADSLDGALVSKNNGDSLLESFDDILTHFFGINPNPNESWVNLGLSSMISMQLRNAISDRFCVTLPSDCFDRYPTSAHLKDFVMNSQGTPIPTKLPMLDLLPSVAISWLTMGILQAFGVVLLLLLFAVPIIPAWFVGKAVYGNEALIVAVGDHRWLQWIWLPIAVPTWMVSFSLCVVLAKWAVVGRYRECEMAIPSIAYLQWWWVDRALHMWEFWVGLYMQDTLLLWLFYWLMGAKIHPSVKLDAFVREFDLVEIKEEATIDYHIQCRKFGPWKDEEEGPRLRFRRILVQKNSIIGGMLSPGVTIGEAAKVEKSSVVFEGAQVPEGILVAGNPAFASGKIQLSPNLSWWKLGILKLMWLVVELYIFFAMVLCGELLLDGRLPSDWRYTPLCYWVLIIAQSMVYNVAVSIVLKWILIGRRKPGPFADSVLRTVADWIVDYHHGIGTFVLHELSSNSRVWNLVQRLYGVDIDMHSRTNELIPPSQADLISIKRSFVSTVFFNNKLNGEYKRTDINESSIGWGVRVGASVELTRTVVPPIRYVTESTVRETVDERYSSQSFLSLLWSEGILLLLYLVLFSMVLLSMVPSYELWMNVIQPASVWIAVPTLAMLLATQTISSLVLFYVLSLAGLGWTSFKGHSKPWNKAFYGVYHSYNWCVQNFTMMSVLWGTPLFGFVLNLLGANVEGRFLFFGSYLFEIPYLSVADRTVSDGAKLVGHSSVYSNITLGPVRVSGILHENTLAMANSTVSAGCKESGPWRYIESDEVEYRKPEDATEGKTSTGRGAGDLEAQI